MLFTARSSEYPPIITAARLRGRGSLRPSNLRAESLPNEDIHRLLIKQEQEDGDQPGDDERDPDVKRPVAVRRSQHWQADVVDDQRVQQVERVGTPRQQPAELARQEPRQQCVLSDQPPVEHRYGERKQEIVDQYKLDKRAGIKRNMPINADQGATQDHNHRKTRQGVPASGRVKGSLLLQIHDGERHVDTGEEFDKVAEEGGRQHERRRSQKSDSQRRDEECGHQQKTSQQERRKEIADSY